MRSEDKGDTWAEHRMWAVEEFKRLDANQRAHQKDIQKLFQQLIGLQVRVLMLSGAVSGLVTFLIERAGVK